jgi:hypothetical protein
VEAVGGEGERGMRKPCVCWRDVLFALHSVGWYCVRDYVYIGKGDSQVGLQQERRIHVSLSGDRLSIDCIHVHSPSPSAMHPAATHRSQS